MSEQWITHIKSSNKRENAFSLVCDGRESFINQSVTDKPNQETLQSQTKHTVSPLHKCDSTCQLLWHIHAYSYTKGMILQAFSSSFEALHVSCCRRQTSPTIKQKP